MDLLKLKSVTVRDGLVNCGVDLESSAVELTTLAVVLSHFPKQVLHSRQR